MPPCYLIWFLLGLVFALAELAIPGLILVFFAAGAWIVAFLTALVDLSLPVQLGSFLGSSLLCLVLLRRHARKVFRGAETDLAGEGGQDQDIGKLAVVTKAITPQTTGEIKYRGSFWSATASQEIPEGATVSIRGRNPDNKMLFWVALPGDPIAPPTDSEKHRLV